MKSFSPDKAMINLYLREKADDAKTANSLAEQKVKIIKSVIKDLKLPDSVLTLSGVNVHQYRDYNRNKQLYYRAQFNAQITLEANSKEVTKVITSIQEKTNAELNLSFGFFQKTLDEIEGKLLKLAIKDAKKKGKIIASSFDFNDMKVINVTYGSFPTPQPIYQRSFSENAMAMTAVANDAGVEMDIKEQSLSRSVKVTFVGMKKE